ncbi:PadR family transcriptional regulator [Bacillus pumilus]|uniref:PadR family transcriptional regulator n=1 Tax=Bacillus pumilus TaxID=1408 RepID=UPI00209ED07A|nr:PadR family transcriptional regulator [Bacillus pumilus]MCP1528798.1 DNA-binding PadR family transcriptional regulator [Bacillus pumilus]MDF9784182.1 DNA-binding PadR family transcriptional regulator [Bacillus pumilus]
MTDLYILGLISMKSMSGYDVEQNLKNTMVDRWGGILVGSIYYALNKLEKGNYIKVCETRTVGKKSTKIYKITELGKEHKKECVMKCLVEPQNTYPTQLFAGLMFADEIEKQEAVKSLNIQIEAQKRHLAEIKKGEEEKEKQMNLPPLTRLTFDYIYEMEEMKMKYLYEAIHLIKTRELTDE